MEDALRTKGLERGADGDGLSAEQIADNVSARYGRKSVAGDG